MKALTLLKDSKSKSPDIETLYKEYSNEYCNYIISQTDILISEQKYEEAITKINEGKAVATEIQR